MSGASEPSALTAASQRCHVGAALSVAAQKQWISVWPRSSEGRNDFRLCGRRRGAHIGQKRSSTSLRTDRVPGTARAYRTATCASPALRSRTVSVPTTSSGILGWSRYQPGKRGNNQRLAKAAVVVTISGPSDSTFRTASMADAKVLRPSWITGNNCAPASVSLTGRGRRWKRATPQKRSNMRIWWLIAVGVTPSSDAARLKLRCRATASKARNSIRGGKLCTQKFYINPIHQKLKSLKFTRPALPVLLPKSIRHQGRIMVDQTIATTHGTPVTLSTTKVERFASGLAGSLLRRSDKDYDQARRVWNAMVDKRPALIARCAGTADVVASVRFAREHDLLISGRGGGHNYAGKSVCEGGLMIDLSPMKGIIVDPGRQTARADAGLRLGEFDQATQAHGLATTLGVNTDTGIAGLTLGGGYGWLGGRFGLACDNLLAAEVVTADGRQLTASADENS